MPNGSDFVTGSVHRWQSLGATNSEHTPQAAEAARLRASASVQAIVSQLVRMNDEMFAVLDAVYITRIRLENASLPVRFIGTTNV